MDLERCEGGPQTAYMADNKNVFLNRDLSWLSFNQRVLMEAADKSVPLYSRISFLSIFSSNLDEFFRVRVGTYKRMINLESSGAGADRSTKTSYRVWRHIKESDITRVEVQQHLFVL